VSISFWADEYYPDYGRYIFEQTGKEAAYVDVRVLINEDRGVNELFKGPMDPETSDIVDGLRRRAIEDYYDQRENREEFITNISISDRKRDLYYQYQLYGPLDIETIRQLAKDSAVEVYFMTEDSEYRMRSDGSLILTQQYYKE
jgi:hypothetical protein